MTKRATLLGLLAALAVLGTLASARPAAAAGYYVYCANGRIEVDSRDPAQMRGARGSNVCLLSSFNYLSDAQSFAQKNFGGAGRSCACG